MLWNIRLVAKYIYTKVFGLRSNEKPYGKISSFSFLFQVCFSFKCGIRCNQRTKRRFKRLNWFKYTFFYLFIFIHFPFLGDLVGGTYICNIWDIFFLLSKEDKKDKIDRSSKQKLRKKGFLGFWFYQISM